MIKANHFPVFVCVLLCLSLANFSAAAVAEDELGCVRGDCENGEGTLIKMTPTGKTVYVGDFINGQYHGSGRLNHEGEQWVYKGRWKAGKRDGRGIYWDKNNNIYIGQWRNDRRNGQGSQFFAVEDWKEDAHTENWLLENTENYSGSFKNDVFAGHGVYRWQDGTRYVGEWAANKKHGEGYFEYTTGLIGKRKFEFDKRVY
ncbi:MAG: hypothetical protein RQ899_12330 [Pseudomonadales bacterium]|nr:hypothetical protein [Pseudomonadales bacterium]